MNFSSDFNKNREAENYNFFTLTDAVSVSGLDSASAADRALAVVAPHGKCGAACLV